MANNQTVIATAGLISVSVGTVNSIVKDKKPPSTRFLIGSGVAFLVLSAMANGGEALAELAKGLAVGVMTTVLLGDGGGVLTYLGDREMDTRKGRPAPKGSDQENASQEGRQMTARVSWPDPLDTPRFTPNTYRLDTLTAPLL